MEEQERPIERTVIESTTLIGQIHQLVNDVDKLITQKLDFQSFIVISIGIELLGSLYDSSDINDFGQSGSRFRNGLKDFKDEWYKKNATWLFENLRGPLIHQYRPGAEIKLTSACKHNVPASLHLTLSEGKRLFVLEQLFDDFKKALNTVNHKLNKKTFSTHKKAELAHQEVVVYDNTPASGATMSTEIIMTKDK